MGESSKVTRGRKTAGEEAPAPAWEAGLTPQEDPRVPLQPTGLTDDPSEPGESGLGSFCHPRAYPLHLGGSWHCAWGELSVPPPSGHQST